MVLTENSSIDPLVTDGCKDRDLVIPIVAWNLIIEYLDFFETSSPRTAFESSSGSTTLQPCRCSSFEYCQSDRSFTWWTNRSKCIDNWTIENQSSNIFQTSSKLTIGHFLPFSRLTPLHASPSISIHGDFSRNESMIEQIDDELVRSMEISLAARKELHNYDQRHSSFCSSSSSLNKESKIPDKASSFRPRQCFRCLLVHVSQNILLCSYSWSFISHRASIWWTKSSRTFFLRLQHQWRSSSRSLLIQRTHQDD